MTLPSNLATTRSGRAVVRAVGSMAALCVVALSTALVTAAGTPAHADAVAGRNISRAEVIARAHHWLSKRVRYSQSAYHPDAQGRGYRTDCSGFISMAWHLDRSRTTATLDDVSTAISTSSLKPGDILLRRDRAVRHAVLFERWTDAAHSRANIIALANRADDMEYYRDVPVDRWASYTAYRYKKIVDDDGVVADRISHSSDGGPRCRVGQPGRAAVELSGRRVVQIEIRACIGTDPITTNVYRYDAWITVIWGPDRDSGARDDRSAVRGFVAV